MPLKISLKFPQVSNSFRFLWKHFAKYKLLLSLAVLGSILDGLAYSSLSFLLKHLIDKVIVEKNLYLLKLFALGLLFIGLIKEIGFFLSEFLYKKIVINITNNLRMQAYKKLCRLTFDSFISRQSQFSIESIILTDIKDFKTHLEGFGVKLLREFFTALAMIGVLIYLDAFLFLIFIPIALFLVIIFSYFGKKRKKYAQLYQNNLSKFLELLKSVVNNFENIKFFDYRKTLEIFKKEVKKLKDLELKALFYTTLYLVLVETLGFLFAALIIYIGGYRVIEGHLTPGAFISFIGSLFILYTALQNLQKAAINFKSLEAIIERIEAFLSLKEEEKKVSTVQLKPWSKGPDIKIENLSIQVKTENSSSNSIKKILSDFSIEIPSGRKVFIEGPSGRGKSTFIKVLAKIISNSPKFQIKGKIFYNGIPIEDIPPSFFRQNTYYQSQKVMLFNTTIRDNLLLVNPSADEEALKRALILAKADFVFQKLPKGLDTDLGKDGITLSGGEEQRIALARLFLNPKPLIFLDEATASVDKKTEEEIIKNLLKEFPLSTIFFISHRTEQSKFFDMKISLL